MVADIMVAITCYHKLARYMQFLCFSCLTFLLNIAAVPFAGFQIFSSSHEWNAFWGSLFKWYSKNYSNISYGCHQQPAIHGVWLPVNQFRKHLHDKNSFGENIQYNTHRLIRYLNQVFTNISLEANEVKIFTDKKMMVFWHEYQKRAKVGKYFFNTGKAASAVPKLPTFRMYLNGTINVFH